MPAFSSSIDANSESNSFIFSSCVLYVLSLLCFAAPAARAAARAAVSADATATVEKAVGCAASNLQCGEAVSPRSCPHLDSSLVIERLRLGGWGSGLYATRGGRRRCREAWRRMVVRGVRGGGHGCWGLTFLILISMICVGYHAESMVCEGQ